VVRVQVRLAVLALRKQVSAVVQVAVARVMPVSVVRGLRLKATLVETPLLMLGQVAAVLRLSVETRRARLLVMEAREPRQVLRAQPLRERVAVAVVAEAGYQRLALAVLVAAARGQGATRPRQRAQQILVAGAVVAVTFQATAEAAAQAAQAS